MNLKHIYKGACQALDDRQPSFKAQKFCETELSGALNQGKKHEKYDSRQQTVNNEGRHADPFRQADGYLDTGIHADSRDRRTARQGDQVRVQGSTS